MFLYLQIPSLNEVALHDLKANCLVRFRCMIQDMYFLEFFLAEYETVNKASGRSSMRSGRYKDIAECEVRSFLKLLGKSSSPTRQLELAFCFLFRPRNRSRGLLHQRNLSLMYYVLSIVVRMNWSPTWSYPNYRIP